MRQKPDFKKSSSGRGKRSTDEIRSPTPNIKFTTQVDSGVRAFSLVPVLRGLSVNRRQFVSIERIASVKERTPAQTNKNNNNAYRASVPIL